MHEHIKNQCHNLYRTTIRYYERSYFPKCKHMHLYRTGNQIQGFTRWMCERDIHQQKHQKIHPNPSPNHCNIMVENVMHQTLQQNIIEGNLEPAKINKQRGQQMMNFWKGFAWPRLTEEARGDPGSNGNLSKKD